MQIFGDGAGRVMALGERDCSLQRRNQKVVEEAPRARVIGADAARRMDAAATRLGAAAHYASAGTVEFVVDARAGTFSSWR